MNTANIESKLSVTQLHKLASDSGPIANEKWRKAIKNSNDPMAILYRKLISRFTPDMALEWHRDNPELASEMRDFINLEYARVYSGVRNELMLKYWGI